MPAPVAGLLTAVVVTAALGLFDLATDGETSWTEALTRLAVFTVVYTVVLAWIRRRERVPGVSAADRAVRSGELPSDAAPTELRSGLLHVKRSMQRSAWVAGGLLGLMVVGALIAAVASEAHAEALVAGAVLLAVLLGFALLVHRRQRRIDRLLAELDAQPVD